MSKLHNYDLYIFDWDGTLADSHDIWLDALRTQLLRYNIRLSDQQIIEKLFGRYNQGIKEFGLPDADIPKLIDEVIAVGRHQFPKAPLYANALKALQTLKRLGKQTALLTASYREGVDLALAFSRLNDQFDIVVTGDEVPAQKPDPSGIHLIVQRLGVAPSGAIMVGDSPKDILAGKNAGIDTLLFHPPTHASQHDTAYLAQIKPTYTIAAWQDLLDRLQ